MHARSSSSPHGSDMAAFEGLTDDLIVEILSRIPAKSLCRFRCVCKRWLNLIDGPDNRKRLAQPLAGFFYNSTSQNRSPRTALHFVNANGSGRPLFYPSFDFLPHYRGLDLIDCCNGLLLSCWHDASTTRGDDSYVVCNPATQQWVALPDDPDDCTVGAARLGFNPAVSSHFHVFLLLEDARRYLSGVYVYSSVTGRWIYKEKGWDEDVWLADPLSATVFVNGCLHFRTVCGLDLQRTCLAAVDTNGGTWSRFDAPCGLYGSDPYLAIIQQSQGRLHYACFNTGGDYDEIQLEVYSLDDYAKKEWILKHRVGEHSSNVEIFGAITNGDFNWIAIHPERNLIFFIETPDKTPMSYSMDGQKVGFGGKLREGQTPYLPYVPLYSELESLCGRSTVRSALVAMEEHEARSS